jgi:uncharacterized protein (DUF1800 family)
MICYLDNTESIGANSPIGIQWGAGHNQNLAREILELHTMGVGGGYTELDVDNLAKVLTGWSYVRGWEADEGYNGGTPANRGKFIFRADWHEPGSKRILGKTFGQSGMKQAIAVLKYLAAHKSTAQYIAFKLVRHFITDKPKPAMVKPIAKAFRTSGGDLKTVARALVKLDKAWTTPLRKLRTPYELQVAEFRAMKRTYPEDDRWSFVATLDALRHRPWERGTPDGYSDENVHWMGPDAMRIRLETAQMNARQLEDLGTVSDSAPQLASKLFGKALSKASKTAIAGPEDFDDGLTMIFMVPEFQRR